MAKASLIGFLLLTFLTGLGLSQEQNKQDEKATEESRREALQWKQNYLKTRPFWHKRSHGVKLDTTVEIKGEETGNWIHIKWTLDYNGPRPPLTILEPRLWDTSGQTVVEIAAEGNDNLLYRYDLESSRPFNPFAPRRPELFLKVEKGKKSKDVIVFELEKIGNFFRAKYPRQFPAAPAEVYLQLVHKPYERGGDLDAWTGEVRGNFHKVKLLGP